MSTLVVVCSITSIAVGLIILVVRNLVIQEECFTREEVSSFVDAVTLLRLSFVLVLRLTFAIVDLIILQLTFAIVLAIDCCLLIAN